MPLQLNLIVDSNKNKKKNNSKRKHPQNPINKRRIMRAIRDLPMM